MFFLQGRVSKGLFSATWTWFLLLEFLNLIIDFCINLPSCTFARASFQLCDFLKILLEMLKLIFDTFYFQFNPPFRSQVHLFSIFKWASWDNHSASDAFVLERVILFCKLFACLSHFLSIGKKERKWEWRNVSAGIYRDDLFHRDLEKKKTFTNLLEKWRKSCKLQFRYKVEWIFVKLNYFQEKNKILL